MPETRPEGRSQQQQSGEAQRAPQSSSETDPPKAEKRDAVEETTLLNDWASI